jgi:hypothetical protein
MDDKLEEEAFIEFMNAREAALQGAVGYFMLANVPSHLIEAVRATTTEKTIALACSVALWHREKRPGSREFDNGVKTP